MTKSKKMTLRLVKLAIIAFVVACLCITVIQYFKSENTTTVVSQKTDPSNVQAKQESVQAGAQSFGFAIGSNVTGLPSSARLIELKKIRNAGITEVRFDMGWHTIQQKNSTTYNWSMYDSLMKDLKSADLNSVITLHRTPEWARMQKCKTQMECPPADPKTFAAFAGKAASRYKDYSVTAWEVWNEPNIENFWKPTPNSQQYADMLKAASVAIKKIDSTAIILVGGLEGKANDGNSMYIDGRSFLASLYEAGVGRYFDGVAYHPYTSLRLPNSPSSRNGWLKMEESETSIRSIMKANGDEQKQIWITEFGVPTGGPGEQVEDLTSMRQLTNSDHVNEENQALIIDAAVKDVRTKSWIRNFDLYSYKDLTSNPRDKNNYGVMKTDGEPKSAYSTYINSIK